MKNKKFIFIIIGVIGVALLAFYLSRTGIGIKSLPGRTSQEPAPATGHEGHGGGAPQAKPEETNEEAEEAPTVEIPTDKQQMLGVKTTEVAVRPLQKVIRTVGRIEYDEKKLATVNTKFEGWIERLYVDYTGRYVKKGEPLAEIYSPELYATQQEFLSILKWAKNNPSSLHLEKGGNEKVDKVDIEGMLSKDANSIVAAAKERLKLWDISDDQIRRIEKSGKPMRTLTIFSPVNGYVVQKMALKGMRVMPGEKLFDIADLSTVWLISDIYEYELPVVKVGDMAKISLSYFPEKEFSSRIDFLYPTLSGETRTAKVRFTIGNPNGRLKPGMFSNVEVKINLGKKLSIPDDAVLDTGTRQVVYVDKGEGNFEPREVILGIRAEGLREVLRGLRPGEKVASSAAFLIDSEAQLKGVKPLKRD
jgi:Cu(I)/Ag(I) efflux system membrane fusion protein